MQDVRTDFQPGYRVRDPKGREFMVISYSDSKMQYADKNGLVGAAFGARAIARYALVSRPVYPEPGQVVVALDARGDSAEYLALVEDLASRILDAQQTAKHDKRAGLWPVHAAHAVVRAILDRAREAQR